MHAVAKLFWNESGTTNDSAPPPRPPYLQLWTTAQSGRISADVQSRENEMAGGLWK